MKYNVNVVQFVSYEYYTCKLLLVGFTSVPTVCNYTTNENFAPWAAVVRIPIVVVFWQEGFL